MLAKARQWLPFSGRQPSTVVRAAAPTYAVGDPAAPRVLITGGNTGIGFIAAKELCKKGYACTLACRDNGRAAGAVNAIKSDQPTANVDSVQLDLSSLRSVEECYESLKQSGNVEFDVVLCNAGVMATPKMQTKDGFEYQLGVNHLGHFALLHLLLPHLLEAKDAAGAPKKVRIINVSSSAHQFGKVQFDDLFRDKEGAYAPWDAYGQSKLANLYFTYELARRLQGSPQVTVNALHPGVVKTELGRYMVDASNQWYMGPAIALASVFFKTPEQGAETSIYLASSPEVANTTSKYFVDCKPVASNAISYDPEIAKKFWEVSEQLVLDKIKSKTYA